MECNINKVHLKIILNYCTMAIEFITISGQHIYCVSCFYCTSRFNITRSILILSSHPHLSPILFRSLCNSLNPPATSCFRSKYSLRHSVSEHHLMFFFRDQIPYIYKRKRNDFVYFNIYMIFSIRDIGLSANTAKTNYMFMSCHKNV